MHVLPMPLRRTLGHSGWTGIGAGKRIRPLRAAGPVIMPAEPVSGLNGAHPYTAASFGLGRRLPTFRNPRNGWCYSCGFENVHALPQTKIDHFWMDTRTYLKKVFSLDIGVESSTQVLDIPMYAEACPARGGG